MFSIVLRENYLFLKSNGVIPTYRLKYLPKKEALGKFREYAISWIVILVPFSYSKKEQRDQNVVYWTYIDDNDISNGVQNTFTCHLSHSRA